MICCICNKNEANKTGTHIFPAWMVSSAFDEKSRGRDYEVIYSIKPFYIEPFFGKSVLPEQIEENIGKVLEDDVIKKQHNPLVVDNAWCIECENRFRILEEYFLDNVDRKVNDFSNIDNVRIQVLNRCNNFIIRLFIYSLVIRADLTHFMDFKLDYKSRIMLLKFINTFVKSDLKNTIITINNSNQKQKLLIYPLRLIKAELDENSTNNIVYVHKKYDRPYCLIINRYVIQFYGQGNQARFKPTSFFGISNIIKNSENFRNYKEEYFMIALFNLKLWNEIEANFNKNMADILRKNQVLFYEKLVKKKLGFIPSKTQIDKFFYELNNNEAKIGEKLAPIKVYEAMKKSLEIN